VLSRGFSEVRISAVLYHMHLRTGRGCLPHITLRLVLPPRRPLLVDRDL
jgi:hypothetical protein